MRTVRFHNFVVACLFGMSATASTFKNWSWSIPTNDSGSWSASESETSSSLSGSFSRISANKFIKLTVDSGSGEAPANGSVRYGLEAPGFSFFVQPTLTSETRLIATAITGSCPTTSWTGNFVFSHWPSTGFDMTGNVPAFGHFTWNPSTNTLRLDSVYKLSSYTLLGTNVDITGTCSNGVITLSGTGDRGGSIYISNRSGSVHVINTATNAKMIYAVPDNSIPSLATLDGTYSAFTFDHASSPSIGPYQVTIDSGGSDKVQFSSVTDIDNNTVDSDEGFKLSNVQINNPLPGMLTGDLVTRTGGADTPHSNSEVVCVVHLTTRTVMSCIGHNNGVDATAPRAFKLVSNAQALPSGTLDSYSFGTTGAVSHSVPTTDNAYSTGRIVLQSDGKVVLSGTTYNGANLISFLARRNPDGTLDSSFGTNGVALVSHSSFADVLSPDLIVQTDGKLVQYSSSWSVNFRQECVVARFLTNGELDTAFGTGGRVWTDSGITNHCYAYSLIQQSTGKYVATGDQGGTTDILTLFRYHTHGVLDTTFGTSGKIAHTFLGLSTPNAAMNLTGDKLIVVGATGAAHPLHPLIARLSSNGVLDTSFGTSGRRVVTYEGTSEEAFNAVVSSSNGTFVAGGASETSGGNQRFLLARFTSNGVLDTSFGTSGLTMTSLGSSDHEIVSMGTQSDYKTVVSGNLGGSSVVARYTTAGVLDASFGSNGVVTIADSSVSSMSIQSDGKFVTGGTGGEGLQFFRLWP